MAYNRRNKLIMMQKVISIYQRHKNDGVSTIYVYRNYIYPVYPISLNTLYNYLSTPVQREIKKYDISASLNGRQMQLAL